MLQVHTYSITRGEKVKREEPLALTAGPAGSQSVGNFFITQAFKVSYREKFSKVQNDKLSAMRALLATVQGESEASRLLKKERENSDVCDQLEKTRVETRQRLDQLKDKKVAFEKRQDDLKKVVAENESFIRDTDRKIEHATIRVKVETEECRRKDRDILRLEKHLEELTHEAAALQKELSTCAPHKAFLFQAVRENETEFDGDVDYLLSRMKNLEVNNVKLHQALTDILQKLEMKKKEVQECLQSIENNRLIMRSESHAKQAELERTKEQARSLQQKHEIEVLDTTMKEMLQSSVSLAIDDLFSRVLKTYSLKGASSKNGVGASATLGGVGVGGGTSSVGGLGSQAPAGSPRGDAAMSEEKSLKVMEQLTSGSRSARELKLLLISERLRELSDIDAKARAIMEKREAGKGQRSQVGDEDDEDEVVEFITRAALHEKLRGEKGSRDRERTRTRTVGGAPGTLGSPETSAVRLTSASSSREKNVNAPFGHHTVAVGQGAAALGGSQVSYQKGKGTPTGERGGIALKEKAKHLRTAQPMKAGDSRLK